MKNLLRLWIIVFCIGLVVISTLLTWSRQKTPGRYALTYVADNTIYRERLPNGRQEKLLEGMSRVALWAWSPDDQWLIFSAGRHQQLYRMRGDGSDLTQLTYTSADNRYADWSPDGRWLVFDSNRSGVWGIYKMRPDGSQLQRLTTASLNAQYPSWSPDGKTIIFTATIAAFGADIYQMQPDGSNMVLLAQDIINLTEYYGVDAPPKWSPDGEWVLYTFNNTQTYNPESYRVRKDGLAAERFTNTPQFALSPIMSPDGNWVAFLSRSRPGVGVYRMQLGSSEIIPVTLRNDSPLLPVSWSPDGNWILAQEIISPWGNSLYRLPASGGQPELLHKGGGHRGSFLWSQLLDEQPWRGGFLIGMALLLSVLSQVTKEKHGQSRSIP